MILKKWRQILVSMVVFQALTWEARDADDQHLISIFGKTEDGKSVCVTTAFNPYFFVKLPLGTKPSEVELLYDKLCTMKKTKDCFQKHLLLLLVLFQKHCQ